MAEVTQQIVNGLALGAVYALIALGYTMVYGVLQFINFAHGEVYMLGAYCAVVLFSAVAGFPIVAVILIVMLATGLFGVGLERIAYRPLRGASRLSPLITAIAVSLLLQNLTIRFAGARAHSFPDVLPTTSFQIGGVTISSNQALLLGSAVVLMFTLQRIVYGTRLGLAMRAVSFDKETASLMGVNVDTSISWTFFLGSALAGASGVLVGIYYNSIDPLMGVMAGLKAFVAAVLGGVGSVPGAMVGGIFLGLLEGGITGIGLSKLRDVVAFGILILVLLYRPTGLFGRR